jgi:cysteine desulfurase/selenocysteine lyase
MKELFPIFSEKKDGKDLVYLDSAATTHKPLSVIESMSHFYAKEYSTIHRGLYDLAHAATASIESVRGQVARFISCGQDEVIFTHSATESINLVAYSYGEKNISEGDELLVCIAEHHSNYLPWKMLCERKKAHFITFDIHHDGTINLEDLKRKVGERTKIIAVSHQSNVFGVINPIKEIAEIAHQNGAVILVDGSQMVAHEKVDVKELNADFYAFSSHKMYGPTGVGVLYGKYSLLDKMDPFHGGGGMVETIDGDVITYRKPPYKFEAGTPMIASIIGLGEAISFIERSDISKIKELSILFYDALKEEVDFVTPLCRGMPILTFAIKGMHSTDVAILLSLDNISIRTGNMCAQPLLHKLGKTSLIRISLGIYNDKEDLLAFLSALSSLRQER